MKLQDIIGNESAKRAIEVALTGNHTIILLSTINSHAEDLLKATKQIAKVFSINFNGDIISLCPCKAYSNSKYECNCSISQIKKHIKKIASKVRNADIVLTYSQG
jgi:predicted ATPase with chaperone activity